jgi:hypothetical protein
MSSLGAATLLAPPPPPDIPPPLKVSDGALPLIWPSEPSIDLTMDLALDRVPPVEGYGIIPPPQPCSIIAAPNKPTIASRRVIVISF